MIPLLVDFIAAFIASLGELAESEEIWASVAPWLKSFGQTVGLSAAVIEAMDQSSSFAEFCGRLQADIAGGDVGAAAVIVFGGIIVDALTGGTALPAQAGATALTASAVGLRVAVEAAGAAFGAMIGSHAANNLFTQAYNDLVQAFETLTAPAPASWTEIGEDSSGDSLLLDAVFSNAIGAALGLGNDSTMLVDIASSATQSSTSPLYNGNVAANSLLTDANLIGTLVAAGEIGGAAPTNGSINPLAGAAVTEALCEIAVQYAGDQAATAANGPGFLLDPNPYGDFSASTSSVLSVDLNPADWTTTYAQTQPVIVGEQAFLDALATNILGTGAPTTFADNYFAQNNPSLIEAALTPGATLSDSSAATSYQSTTANAVLIGQNDTTISAGNGNDLIIGGENVTVGNGDNIIVGTGQGGETINAGTGSNLIYAPGSGNVITLANPQGPNLNIVYLGSGGDTLNVTLNGGGLESDYVWPALVSDFSEQNLLDLNTIAFESAVFPYGVPYVGIPNSELPITIILMPIEPTPGDSIPMNVENDSYANDGGETIPNPMAAAIPPDQLTPGSGLIYDLADYQQTDLAPPPPQSQPGEPAPPASPPDPGPTAGAVDETLDVGDSLDLTSAILAAATPGLPGDVLSITSVNVSGTIGALSFNNGDVTYTALASAFSGLAANSSEADSFSYTLSDQLGDTATGEVELTVDNPVAVVSGPQYGGATIEGVDGAEDITASGYSNVIDANGGSGTINAGQGSATVDAGSGNLTINLGGYSDSVSGGDGADIVSGSQGNAVITLGDGSDSVTTGGYNNVITLGNGDDTVNAGAGNETITLGDGNDSVTAQGYDNVINVGNGNNVISAGAGDETIVAGSGSNTITAQGYDNSITLGAGTNNVMAGAGSDTVTANGGDDIFTFNSWNDLANLLLGDNATIYDNGGGLQVDVGSANSVVSVAGFDPQIWIDLLNPNVSYASTTQVMSALTSDGHGGTLLPLAGGTGSIDFLNMSPTQLHASNFNIG